MDTEAINFTKPHMKKALDMPTQSLTFDEFYPFRNRVKCDKICFRGSRPSKASILEAMKFMRTLPAKNRQELPCCYSLSISSNDDLDSDFSLPEIVRENDMFTNFWPQRKLSNYLRERNKLFHGLSKGYESSPRIAYGGTTEWLQIISGILHVTLYKPTERNLIKFSAWTPNETFKLEEGTRSKHDMTPGSFLMIPPGYISIRRAKSDCFMMGGEFLQLKPLAAQLERLEIDIMNSNGRYPERDSEIRSMYWFFAAKILSPGGRATLLSLNFKNAEYLKNSLLEWKKRNKTTVVPQNLYAPTGIQIDLICRDIGQHISAISRKSFKSQVDLVNILNDQTSAYNKTN